MKMKAWHNLLPKIDETRPVVRPRKQGLTMVLDRCQGLEEIKDLLDLSGDYIDQIKLSFGTSMFLDEEILREKIEVIRARQIDIYPGGTLMEAALTYGVYGQYLKRARELGFNAVEISDGTITMTQQVRRDAIHQALDFGFKVITEVGKKDPAIEIPPHEQCVQVGCDLDAGAEMVIIEARESGRGIGIYDNNGAVRVDKLEALIDCLGPLQSRIMWEAPGQRQQTALILRCGSNINLGNVRPADVLGLEALRCGLRFETFNHFLAQVDLQEDYG